MGASSRVSWSWRWGHHIVIWQLICLLGKRVGAWPVGLGKLPRVHGSTQCHPRTGGGKPPFHSPLGCLTLASCRPPISVVGHQGNRATGGSEPAVAQPGRVLGEGKAFGGQAPHSGECWTPTDKSSWGLEPLFVPCCLAGRAPSREAQESLL